MLKEAAMSMVEELIIRGRGLYMIPIKRHTSDAMHVGIRKASLAIPLEDNKAT